jgi:secreted trypsin-like serine protease
LLPNTESLNPGEATLLAGYGITSGMTQKGVGTLREVIAPILSAVGKTEIAIDESHRKGSCNGDSGGPAFIQKGTELYLWGVTSRGDEECASEGIYTQINAYSDWIIATEAVLRK